MSSAVSRKWAWWVALAAACAGLATLGAWFPKYWPAASWPVLRRAQLIGKARGVAQHFGLNTAKSNTTMVASLSKSLARYVEEHSSDISARTVSPLTVRITFAGPKKDQTSKVGLDSAGLPVYWKPSDDFKPAQKYASEDEAARAAFAFLAGAQAASFSGPRKSMGEEATQEEYVWKKTPPPRSDLRERLTVLTQDGGIARAEHKLYVSSESDEDDSDSGDSEKYWSVLSGIFWTLSIGALITIFSIYFLWSVRKTLNHRFQGRMAILRRSHHWHCAASGRERQRRRLGRTVGGVRDSLLGRSRPRHF